jgi:hypothetical protein
MVHLRIRITKFVWMSVLTVILLILLLAYAPQIARTTPPYHWEKTLVIKLVCPIAPNHFSSTHSTMSVNPLAMIPIMKTRRLKFVLGFVPASLHFMDKMTPISVLKNAAIWPMSSSGNKEESVSLFAPMVFSKITTPDSVSTNVTTTHSQTLNTAFPTALLNTHCKTRTFAPQVALLPTSRTPLPSNASVNVPLIPGNTTKLSPPQTEGATSIALQANSGMIWLTHALKSVRPVLPLTLTNLQATVLLFAQMATLPTSLQELALTNVLEACLLTDWAEPASINVKTELTLTVIANWPSHNASLYAVRPPSPTPTLWLAIPPVETHLKHMDLTTIPAEFVWKAVPSLTLPIIIPNFV